MCVAQVKLVSIDAADVADGHSSIILGLIWNIILFFQVIISLPSIYCHLFFFNSLFHRERPLMIFWQTGARMSQLGLMLIIAGVNIS